MPWVAGADGCRKGWFRISLESQTSELRFHCLERAQDLLEIEPKPISLGIDIPIGLAYDAPRECDKKARACLSKARKSSVFPAPIRPVLQFEDYADACKASRNISGKNISKQTFYLLPKIREIDQFLQKRTKLRERVIEVHPEVSFWAWAGSQQIKHSKKTLEGHLERLKLVKGYFGETAFTSARKDFLKKEVADHDILDAFATLWTSCRWAKGIAKILPEIPEKDKTGLPMQIGY